MCGTFGSTSDGTPRALRRLDRRLRGHLRDRPLLVVGDEHHVGARPRPRGSCVASADSSVSIDRAIALVVDPRHLLVPGRDHAQLPRRAAVAVRDHRRGADAGLAQIGDQARALRVVADQSRDLARCRRAPRRCAPRWRRRPGGSSRGRTARPAPAPPARCDRRARSRNDRASGRRRSGPRGRRPDRAAPSGQSARRAWGSGTAGGTGARSAA